MKVISLKMKNLIIIVMLVIIIALFWSIYMSNSVKVEIGSKNITIEVVNKDKESAFYELQTDAEYLRQAMEEAVGLTFDGVESGYGMMVHTVNGERVDYGENGTYWSFYVNNQYCNCGINDQPVHNGDNFKIVYTISTFE